MNHVSLIGRLTKEPEIKYTTSGAAVASGTIAVNRDFTNANGERESDFISFVIWRKAAENFVNMTAKGSQVGLEGSWQTRSYENQQGQRVYVSELVVSNFTLVETKEQTEQRKGQSAQQSNSGFSIVRQHKTTSMVSKHLNKGDSRLMICMVTTYHH
ncbi:single-stranded DNA-binding protein [Weissella confusa]|nr:single-stranded DNA-binding protein [Weissella confusa]MCT0005066.1 single-stranded DNA-binding protein [Weissella confusa]MCT0018755.1 single-stranded DNA-binding protein [Weissella confusa]MCT0039360.1 single-stranded DNA-binding protein [Weissella confusa]